MTFFLSCLRSFTWNNCWIYLIRLFWHQPKIYIRLKVIWLKVKLFLKRRESFFYNPVSFSVHIASQMTNLLSKRVNDTFMNLLLCLQFIVMLHQNLLIQQKLRRKNVLLIVLKYSFSSRRYIINGVIMKCWISFEYDMTFEFFGFGMKRFYRLFGNIFERWKFFLIELLHWFF